MKNEVFNIIKKLCDEKDISISQLEQDLGFGVSTIIKWKTQSPSANRLAAVADYFNVSLDFLMGRIDEKSIIAFQRVFKNVPEEDRTETAAIISTLFDKLYKKER